MRRLLAFGADPNAPVVEAPSPHLPVPATNDSSQAGSSSQGSPGSQPSRSSQENGSGSGDVDDVWFYAFAAGRSPLMVAATLGHASVCALLVRGGARVDAVDNEGWTALDLARRAAVASGQDSSSSSSNSSQRTDTIALLEGVLNFAAADNGGSADPMSAASVGGAVKTGALAPALNPSSNGSLAAAVETAVDAPTNASGVMSTDDITTEAANGEAMPSDAFSAKEQTAGEGEAVNEDAEDGLRRYLEATLSGNGLQLMGNGGGSGSSGGLNGIGMGNGTSGAGEAAPSPFQSDDEDEDDDVEFNSEAFGYAGTSAATPSGSDGKLDVSTLFGGALIFTVAAGDLHDEHGDSSGGAMLGCEGSPASGKSPRRADRGKGVGGGGDGGGSERGGGLDAAGLMAAFDLAAEVDVDADENEAPVGGLGGGNDLALKNDVDGDNLAADGGNGAGNDLALEENFDGDNLAAGVEVVS